jgi:hypothetical protein
MFYVIATLMAAISQLQSAFPMQQGILKNKKS